MEYVNGESIAEIIRRHAPMALGRKLQLLQELYAGLAYAHKVGIIHRDIKPSNLMVTAEGDLKILDFGLARLIGVGDQGLTRTGFMVGTPDYMSPEQIEGRVIDQRSDIFTAGVVMYELLTYQKAFSSDSPLAVLHKIVNTQAPSIRQQLPDVDADLERIVTTATQRDPDCRYHQAELILGDLQRVKARLGDRATDTGVTKERLPSAGRFRAPLNRDALFLLRSRQVAQHLVAAQTHFDALEFTDAIRGCEAALFLDPGENRAIELLDRARDAMDEAQIADWISGARSELSRDSVEAASVLLDRALDLRPGLTEVIELKREAARRGAESGRKLEKEVAVRRALDLAKVNFTQGAFEAALRATGEALAHDPDNQLALAFKQAVNDAISAHQHGASTSSDDRTGAERTIAAGAPSPSVVEPAPYEGTMFIPAITAGPGKTDVRPSVRVTVLQCGDASVVNESFDIGDMFEIGRQGRDLSASDLTWSRRHAVIEYSNCGYAIRDLGSTGGTYVNGRRVRADAPEPLFFGARITSRQQKPMIPVFHEEYVVPDSAGSAEVDELLSFDGIRLMDQQNLYVEEGIDRLAKRIKETCARDRPR